jgi:hypothetical protein
MAICFLILAGKRMPRDTIREPRLQRTFPPLLHYWEFSPLYMRPRPNFGSAMQQTALRIMLLFYC